MNASRESVRIGVIGGGFIGKEHISGLRAAGAIVAAAAEPDAERRRQLESDFDGLKCFADAEAMIRECSLDAVSVCTPNALHAPLSIMALEHGLHVLCEKPMATNASEAAEMVKTARRCGKLLMMAFNQRFLPGIHWIASEVKRGTFGEIYHARSVQIRTCNPPRHGAGGWFFEKRKAGRGVVLDLGSHALYRAWYCMGKPSPVSACGVLHHRFVGEVDDLAAALIRFRNGATLIMEVAWKAARRQEWSTAIAGSRSGALCDMAEGDNVVTVIEFPPEDEPNAPVPGTLLENGARLRKIQAEPPPCRDKYGHFVECITGRARCLCPAEDGYLVQCMLDAVIRSAEEGGEVQVETDESLYGKEERR